MMMESSKQDKSGESVDTRQSINTDPINKELLGSHIAVTTRPTSMGGIDRSALKRFSESLPEIINGEDVSIPAPNSKK